MLPALQLIFHLVSIVMKIDLDRIGQVATQH